VNDTVKKRIVYYIGGFDPRGVRHYHSLYKEHFTKQCAINGMSGRVSSRKKVHNHLYQWEIEANDHGHNVHTTYNFLSWDDIVRDQWSLSLFDYYKDSLLFIRGYLLSGLFLLFTKEAPKQLIAGLYPLVYLMGALTIVFYGSVKVYALVQGWIGIVVGLSIGFGIAVALQRFASRIGVFWLLRIYVFALHWSHNQVRGMDKRIDLFAQELVKILNHSEEVDEILLISHSVGTILSVSVVARALEKSDHWDKFGMITLGECIPLVSFQTNAHHYREELIKLGARKNLLWIDYTSAIDGACFPLYDFIPDHEKLSQKRSFPLYLSPRFHTLFTTMTYKKLRRDWYTAHFLYLMSTQKSGEYDYYAMTAGAKFI
jgi:hypothetical protein